MAKKVTAIVFLIVIFLFGAGTALKLFDTSGIFKGFTFDKKHVAGVNAAIDMNVKSRNNWIDINGAFQRCIGMTFVDDAGDVDVYKLKNNQLIYGMEKQNMDWYIRSVIKLQDYVTKNTTSKMMYVQLPFKVKNDSYMPAGSSEYGNENADELLAGIRKAGVTTLDIRQMMREKKVDYDTAFITTDQHWKPQTARWAADEISRFASKKFGLHYDNSLFKPGQWNTKTYKDWFLGSLGKRTGKYFGGVSDFDIMTPKMKTDFDFKARSVSRTIHRYGPFEKSLLSWVNINKRDLFGKNPYATYIGGDYKINTVRNKLADNDCKVLLVRDSFSCAMQPFLCMNYGTITAIDLRHYDYGSLTEHIAKNDYDLILVAYNPSAFSKEQFTFE